jgi:hypothetical protein
MILDIFLDSPLAAKGGYDYYEEYEKNIKWTKKQVDRYMVDPI